MTIGFIGCGNMAQPIIRSIAKKGLFATKDIFVFDLDAEKLDFFCNQTGVCKAKSEYQIAANCDVVFLCIKPQGFETLLTSLQENLNRNKPFIVSIAAGKPLAFMESYLEPDSRIARVIPNLNASVGQSSSAYCVNNHCTEDDRQLLENIVSCFGTTQYCSEELFSQFFVLAGCAPAYTFMYIDSLAKAAEKNGLERDVALATAIQVVLGSAMYMQQSGISPEILIDRVCSKGGTTIEGITSLRNNEFSDLISTAYEASLHRDRELSGK